MIEWKKFIDPQEVDEEDWLILLESGQIIHATHDSEKGYFIQAMEDHAIIYPYQSIVYYAEIDWPDDGKPMISECEHGHILTCDECAEFHEKATEYVKLLKKPYRL